MGTTQPQSADRLDAQQAATRNRSLKFNSRQTKCTDPYHLLASIAIQAPLASSLTIGISGEPSLLHPASEAWSIAFDGVVHFDGVVGRILLTSSLRRGPIQTVFISQVFSPS